MAKTGITVIARIYSSMVIVVATIRAFVELLRHLKSTNPFGTYVIAYKLFEN